MDTITTTTDSDEDDDFFLTDKFIVMVPILLNISTQLAAQCTAC